ALRGPESLDHPLRAPRPQPVPVRPVPLGSRLGGTQYRAHHQFAIVLAEGVLDDLRDAKLDHLPLFSRACRYPAGRPRAPAAATPGAPSATTTAPSAAAPFGTPRPCTTFLTAAPARGESPREPGNRTSSPQMV